MISNILQMTVVIEIKGGLRYFITEYHFQFESKK